MSDRPGDSGEEDSGFDDDDDDGMFSFSSKSKANLIFSIAKIGCQLISTGVSTYFESKKLSEKENQNKRIEELNNQIIQQSQENSIRLKEKDEKIKLIEEQCKTFKESSITVKRLETLERKEKEKKEKALKLFNEEKEKVFIENQLSIIKCLKKKEDKYFSSILPLKFNVDSIKVIVNNFLSSANLKDEFKHFIERTATKKIQELLKSLMHFNIVLAGKTGVGKSTLINAFLHLSEEEKRAKTGIGQPITQKMTQYESKALPTFRLWDNRGIEIDKYGIEKVVKDIKNLVDTQAKKESLDDYIHAIWYCVSTPGLRFEEIEKNAFKEIMQIYEGDKLPVIIVMTQCYCSDDVETFKAELKKIVPENIDIINVVANKKKDIMTEPFGLDKLLTTTAQKASKATGAACYHCIQLHLKETFDSIEAQNLEQVKEMLKLMLSKPDGFFKENDLNSMMNKHLRSVLEAITSAFMRYNDSSIKKSYSFLFIDKIISSVSLMAQDSLAEFVKEETNSLKEKLSLIFVDLIKKVETECNYSLPFHKCESEWIKEATIKITQTITGHSVIDAYQLIANFVCNAYIDILTELFKETFHDALVEMGDVLQVISQYEVEKETEKMLAKTLELKDKQ